MGLITLEAAPRPAPFTGGVVARVALLGAKGFRPFFLLGAVFAALAVPFWVVALTGAVAPAGPLQGMVWHAHEMLHGFTVAIFAGFLLTAVTNWTGRDTASGPWLLGLAILWLAARVALLVVPGRTGAILDLLFLPALVVAIGRPILQTRNLRNAAFPVVLLVLWGTNLAVYAGDAGTAVIAQRVAVHLIAVMILLVTGRIVPSFTRAATGSEHIRNLRLLDWTATVATALLAALQLVPAPRLQALTAAVAGGAALARTLRWGAWTGRREPLLWILHAGHALVGVGLLLEALVPFGLPLSPALHAIAAGGIGSLTLGMMARVSLGHSGRPLRVRPVMAAAFAAVIAGAVVRVAGPVLAPAGYLTWLWIAAALWAAAFAAFAAVYAPILTSPRADGRPG